MRKFVWIILLLGFSSAGWIIRSVEKAPFSSPETTSTYVANGIILTDNSESRVIMNYKTEEIIFISHSDKIYYKGTFDEWATGFEEMKSKMKKMMEQRLKDVPSEQREMAKEMMKGMMETPEPEVEVKKTGKTATVAGYKTNIYIVETTVQPYGATHKEEVYIAPGVKVVPDEISLEDAKRAEKKFKKIVGTGEWGLWEMEKGFPLKTVSYTPQGETNVEEAISVKKGGIPKPLLEIPEGYKKVEKPFEVFKGGMQENKP